MLLGKGANQRIRVVVFGLVLVTISSAFVVHEMRLPAVEPDVDMLEPGDIIFVDLYQGWCTTCYWDHLAIYVGSEGGAAGYPGTAVVEATFNAGVVLTPLWSFLHRDRPAEMSVRRLGHVPNRDQIIKAAITYAVDQVGKPFDCTAHVTTVPHKIDESNHHCTELVWRSYKAGGLDLDRNDGPLVYSEDIYFSPKLTAVDGS